MSKSYYVKVATGEKDDVRYSFNWAIARRCRLQITPGRIKFCGTVLAPEDIKRAVVIRVRQMFIPGYVLQLETADNVYQIGMMPWVPIKKLLPVPFEEEKQRLKYSTFSIIARIVLLVILVYLLVTGRLF